MGRVERTNKGICHHPFSIKVNGEGGIFLGLVKAGAMEEGLPNWSCGGRDTTTARTKLRGRWEGREIFPWCALPPPSATMDGAQPEAKGQESHPSHPHRVCPHRAQSKTKYMQKLGQRMTKAKWCARYLINAEWVNRWMNEVSPRSVVQLMFVELQNEWEGSDLLYGLLPQNYHWYCLAFHIFYPQWNICPVLHSLCTFPSLSWPLRASCKSVKRVWILLNRPRTLSKRGQ